MTVRYKNKMRCSVCCQIGGTLARLLLNVIRKLYVIRLYYNGLVHSIVINEVFFLIVESWHSIVKFLYVHIVDSSRLFNHIRHC